MRKSSFLLLTAFLFARAASAQVIQGQVVEATSGTSVGAGFVLLLGPDGKEVARALSDQGGRFTLRAAAPGRYRLRSERIGFKVFTSAFIDVGAGQTLDYRLEVAAIPIRLEEIRMTGETRCRVRPEEGRATATVWDEARKALAAVSWVQEQQRIRVRMRTYQRDLETDFRIVRETSQTKTGTTNRAFRAVSPVHLAQRGYVEMSPDGGYVFQAPDADVLFSDQFLNRHCFKMVAGTPATAGMIGLGFEPTGDAKLADIEGTMWLDEKNAELRYVEYRYLNYDLPIESDLIGGRVEFLRLANGGWIVSRYWIRMPVITLLTERKYTSGSQLLRGGGTDLTRSELTALKEEGGEVLAAYAGDGAPLAESLGATLSGTVYDSTRSMPLIGATVRLSGTPYTGMTGPGGAFELKGLPEGMYSVEFAHADFPEWGIIHGPAIVVLQRSTTATATLAVPAPATLVRSICPAIKSELEGAAAGLVKDSVTGQIVRDAVIQLTWKDYGGSNLGIVTEKTMGTEVGSDGNGYFRACNLPLDRVITASVLAGEIEGPPVEFRVTPGGLTSITVLRVTQRAQ